MVYGIISDTHCHNWTMFSHVNEDGVNSRLRIILNNIEEAARAVKKRGGDTLFHAGDLFHVRGSVAPSVLNPTLETFRKIVSMGIRPVLICGNHDAEFRDTNNLGSAIEALKNVNCMTVNEPCLFNILGKMIVLMPWQRTPEEFLKAEKKLYEKFPLYCDHDMICHAALNGVFAHLESSQCVDPYAIKKAYGNVVKRIFAGHLHKHQALGDGVYSVGALCQHNWGDVGSRAGYMIVSDDKEEFFESNAPKFIDIDSSMSLDSIKKIADGNYVRATVEMTEKEVKALREHLIDYGAAGVTIISHLPVEASADRIEINATETLDEITARYINTKYSGDMKKQLLVEAEAMLARA